MSKSFCNTEYIHTSLQCRWHTRTTQCLMPTMLHAAVDGQCGTLLTDDCHQFITLTVHLSWQHLRRWRDNCTCSRSTDMVGAHQNLNGSCDLTTPLPEMVCHLLPSTYLPNLKSLSRLTTKMQKAIQNVENRVGSHKVTGNSNIQ